MPKTNTKMKKVESTIKKKELPAKKAAAKKAASSTAKEEKHTMKSTKTATVSAKIEKPKSGGKVPFKKEITQKLLEAKAKILQEVSHKIRTESDVLKFEIGDIYDIASNERDRELALMLGDRDREKLSEIEDALERIKESSYGTCDECGEPIHEDRLRALPATKVCVECQSKNERELKIKGRFEEESGLGIMERSEGEEEEF